MARRRGRLRSSGGFGVAAAAGVALLMLAVAAFGALAYFYIATPKPPQLDATTLCPVNGPAGITVVLVDTSDDLPETTGRQVLGMLDDLITALPSYQKLDIRVLDIAAARSRSLFARCNPGDGAGLSEWTANPTIARMQWIENFRRPAKQAVSSSLAAAKATSSPIMAAIQDIAIEQFSSEQARAIPKTLIVISDMLEYTRDYSQYPTAGDLSYQRYKQSPAYLKFRTDLHGARVDIRYVQRGGVKIDTLRHAEFWREWIVDNKGTFGSVQRLQGM